MLRYSKSEVSSLSVAEGKIHVKEKHKGALCYLTFLVKLTMLHLFLRGLIFFDNLEVGFKFLFSQDQTN